MDVEEYNKAETEFIQYMKDKNMSYAKVQFDGFWGVEIYINIHGEASVKRLHQNQF